MKTTWNLTHLYPNISDPQITKDLESSLEFAKSFNQKWANEKSYLSDETVLLQAIKDFEEVMDDHHPWNKPGFFIYLNFYLDQDNKELKSLVNKCSEIFYQYENLVQFFEINLGKIQPEVQQKFLKSEVLKDYKHYLEGLFNSAKYVLTDDQEKVFNALSKPASRNWVNMLESFLTTEKVFMKIGEEEKERTYSDILGLIDDPVKSVRDQAALELNKILKKWVRVGENEVNTVLEYKKISDDFRKTKRPDETRLIGDDVTPEIVDPMLEAVEASFDISQRYYKLKAKALGLEKLEYHERNLQVGNLDKELTFEESYDLVYKTFEELSPIFSEILKSFVDESRMDVYPKLGKSSGAFCMSGTKNNLPVILLNHKDKLQDALTLAHETGHGIHFTLSRKQKFLNQDAPTSTAEVASTFMEDFVLRHILNDVDDKLKFSLLMFQLNDEISTIQRQVSCYRFEQDLHKSFREKGYLSKEDIGELFINRMKAYMGDSINYTEDSKNWWMQWSHIRKYFYVYSYASGLLISKGLQHKVRENKEFINNVIEFLSSGSVESPETVFKKLGIDITSKQFWQSGLDDMRKTLDEAEELWGKIGNQ